MGIGAFFRLVIRLPGVDREIEEQLEKAGGPHLTLSIRTIPYLRVPHICPVLADVGFDHSAASSHGQDDALEVGRFGDGQQHGMVLGLAASCDNFRRLASVERRGAQHLQKIFFADVE